MPAKKTIKFFAKKPNMEITLDGTVYKFESGVLEVDTKLAEQVKRHTLYRREHIYSEDDAIVVNGKVQSVRNDPRLEDIQKTKEAEGGEYVIFQFDGRQNIKVDVGPHEVFFEGGKVAVKPEVAEYLRRHMFYRQGRMQEITVG